MANTSTTSPTGPDQSYGLETLRKEIQCYALPFGVIGTLSHILTLYTFLMLAHGLSPWRWKPNKRYKLDAWLASIGLCILVGTTIATLVRCRQKWEFVLMAVWKLVLSVSLNGLSLAAAGYTQSEKVIAKPVIRKRVRITHDYSVWEPGLPGSHHADPGGPKEIRELYDYQVEPTFKKVDKGPVGRYWLAIGFHTMGCIIGVVGLQSLVSQTWEHAQIRNLCYGFGTVALFSPLVIVLGECCIHNSTSKLSGKGAGGTFALVLIVLGFLALLWSDWVLAFIKGQASGAPDGNNAVIGWLYFAAKRTTMFSL